VPTRSLDPTTDRTTNRLTDGDYRRLLHFRTSLRRFLRWSEEQAEAEGLTPAHHQLLLAIRGHGAPVGPTVGDVAQSLLIRHNSAVGLVDRAVEAGYVDRIRDSDDQRVVRLRLTTAGARHLARLSRHHLAELRRFKRGVLHSLP
jgi:DNA-binding MarR family transcriptional regulator